ncbi:cytochrome C assembly family protein [Thalassotalea hakodatensis]|uniref:cytochrome C assembly family protein n=1 Tax=Thalassotalea hakodatensis TaxID=3030492 RepID=UPI0025731D9D|nr:cytochrome c biogenesis protein CcsA [Thalassotalea hakodatensis]
MDFSSIFSLIAFVCYIMASIAVVVRLFHPKGPNIVKVLFIGSIAIISHTLSTGHFLFSEQSVNFALPNVISLVTLIICLSITALALKYKVNLLLPVVYVFAGLWQLTSLFIPHKSNIPLITTDFAVASHVILALIAYCILIIAMLFAFQVTYINMKLKDKNLLAVNHLPPLMQVEGQLFAILAIGTLGLVVSQLVGVIFLQDFLANNAHKTVLSLLALLLYCFTLWGHFKQGWRGHRVLMLIISATTLLTLAYFGSRFVKEFLLS